MRYSDIYLINHDIDWFCIVNGVYIHVASAGGMIPSQVNDAERLRAIQHRVEMFGDIYTDEDIIYNEAAIDRVLSGNKDAKGREMYIESFTAMARKGFVSFDRTNIEDFKDNHYHMVCRPRKYDLWPKFEGVELERMERLATVMVRRGKLELIDNTLFIGPT